MATLRTRHEGAVEIIELNRPEKLNALNLELKSELADAIRAASRRRTTGAVVLTGAGRAFCSGADLTDLHTETGLDYRPKLRWLQASLIEGIARSPKPFIAAVNGPAVGGGFGLALACDLIVATRDAYFESPVVRTVGIAPDFGLAFSLPASVGLHRSRSILLFGERLTASVALDWGLVHRITDRETLLDEALQLAAKVAVAAPQAVAGAKRLLLLGAGAPLERLLETEADELTLLRSSDDHAEAVTAFLEKRKPNFSGD